MTENITFIKIEIIVVAILCGLFLLWLKKWAYWEYKYSGIIDIIEVLIFLVAVIGFVIMY